jgi:hypothetical protein
MEILTVTVSCVACGSEVSLGGLLGVSADSGSSADGCEAEPVPELEAELDPEPESEELAVSLPQPPSTVTTTTAAMLAETVVRRTQTPLPC